MLRLFGTQRIGDSESGLQFSLFDQSVESAWRFAITETMYGLDFGVNISCTWLLASQARGQHSLGEISRPARDARKRQRDSSTCAWDDTAVLYRQEVRAIVRGAFTSGMAGPPPWRVGVGPSLRRTGPRRSASPPVPLRCPIRRRRDAPSPEALLPSQLRPPVPPLQLRSAWPGNVTVMLCRCHPAAIACCRRLASFSANRR